MRTRCCVFFLLSVQATKSCSVNVSPVDTFAKNPQYRIQVTKTEGEQGDKNILFSLMQKPQEQYRNQNKSYPIGLTIFKVCNLNFVRTSTNTTKCISVNMKLFTVKEFTKQTKLHADKTYSRNTSITANLLKLLTK